MQASTPPAAVRVNLARFDLVSIRLVVLCADRGSLSDACRAAHLSKSSASQRLSKLESTFGRQLFVRDARGMRMTRAGELFASRARCILRELEELGVQLAALQEPAVEDLVRCSENTHTRHADAHLSATPS